MSKYLSLCNQLVSVGSTCKEPLPAGDLNIDRYSYISGIFRKAEITHDEWLYGMAVVGDGFGFEVRLQQKAKALLKDKNLSDSKKALRAAGLAELAMLRIRGEKIVRGKKENTAEDYAVMLGSSKRHWHRYKPTYNALCDWCNELETNANIKVWQVLEKE